LPEVLTVSISPNIRLTIVKVSNAANGFLVVWFREKQNNQSRLLKTLSDNSYAAYIIQTPVLVFLALSLRSIQLPLILKFAIVSPIGISLCFAFANLIRKIPKADRVLQIVTDEATPFGTFYALDRALGREHARVFEIFPLSERAKS